MNKIQLHQKIVEIEQEVQRLLNRIRSLGQIDCMTQAQVYEKASLDCCFQAERIACALRRIVFTTTSKSSRELMQDVSKEHHIQTIYDAQSEVFFITLPSLLPKKKQVNSGEFLLSPLYYALQSITSNIVFEKYSNCVICFFHVYDPQTFLKRVRDYDNVETKQILDLVSTFLLVDDSGQYCDTYHTSVVGNSNFTSISIIKKEKFIALLPSVFHTVQNFHIL